MEPQNRSLRGAGVKGRRDAPVKEAAGPYSRSGRRGALGLASLDREVASPNRAPGKSRPRSNRGCRDPTVPHALSQDSTNPFPSPRPPIRQAGTLWAARAEAGGGSALGSPGRGEETGAAPIPELPPGPRRGRPPAAASRAEPYPTSSQATGGAAGGEAAASQPTRMMLSSGRVRPSPARGFPEPAPGQDRTGWVGWLLAEATSKSAY